MKIFSPYKKLMLANLLHWFATRLVREIRVICVKLVSFAIHLDPDRKIFKISLKNISSVKYFKTEKIVLPFHSVPEGCQLLSQNIKIFDVDRRVQLQKPCVINKNFKVSDQYVGEAKLPDTYRAEIKNAIVFSGTDLIVVNNLALYDEITKDTISVYSIKAKTIIHKLSTSGVTIKMPVGSKVVIKQGIHFVKDHSINYFHWLIECLPRLSLIADLDKTIPLLVDEHLPEQSLEALNLLNLSGRPIIKLTRGKRYEVNKLYYPSQLSIVHDNYKIPKYQQDAIYSPEALNYLREQVLKALNLTTSNNKNNRKIYISRTYSDLRQLLNSLEIEIFLISQGFEILFPEHLSFTAQVNLFSQAKIIIGQSGAGMANFIFAPKTCEVLILISDAPQTNLNLFGGVAAAIGVNLKYIVGKHQYIPGKSSLHADFYIDLQILENYINSLQS